MKQITRKVKKGLSNAIHHVALQYKQFCIHPFLLFRSKPIPSSCICPLLLTARDYCLLETDRTKFLRPSVTRQIDAKQDVHVHPTTIRGLLAAREPRPPDEDAHELASPFQQLA
jgi:hypothetical protein